MHEVTVMGQNGLSAGLHEFSDAGQCGFHACIYKVAVTGQ